MKTKYLIIAAIGTIILLGTILAISLKGNDSTPALPSSLVLAVETTPEYLEEVDTVEGGVEPVDLEDTAHRMWIDTVMCAAGHSFGYSGDISMWRGWYYDTIPVGDDIMLRYDSVGPSSLKLSLTTREIVVDLADPMASGKIKNFMAPLKGFKRFRENYKETLDSIVMPKYSYTCTGYYTFTADYADSTTQNATKINKFLCNLAGLSRSEAARIQGSRRRGRAGNDDNIRALSDFLAAKTFEDWRRSGETDESSNAEKLEIRLHVCNPKYATFSMYAYGRIGTGHGMYVETFHTFDLSDEKELTNKDIFKPGSLDEVKKALFETMYSDRRFREWHPEIESPEDIEAMIVGWQSPSEFLEGTELEEPEREITFELPEGALAETGVIFSFQPYEIDCWAAGTAHFVVPYKKLMPYLTSDFSAITH